MHGAAWITQRVGAFPLGVVWITRSQCVFPFAWAYHPSTLSNAQNAYANNAHAECDKAA